MNGFFCLLLINETTESYYIVQLHEDTVTRCHLRTRKWPSLGRESASVLILDFLASRSIRNQLLRFISQPVCGLAFHCSTLIERVGEGAAGCTQKGMLEMLETRTGPVRMQSWKWMESFQRIYTRTDWV